MLELWLIWSTWKHVGDETSRKGLSGSYRFLALLIPVAGGLAYFIVLLLVSVVAVIGGNRDFPAGVPAILFYIIAEITTAVLLKKWVSSMASPLPSGSVSGLPMPAASVPAFPMLEPSGLSASAPASVPGPPVQPASRPAVEPPRAGAADETSGAAGIERPAPIREAVVPQAAKRAGGQAKAGFCTACMTRVWLLDDDGCCNGHARSQVRGVYLAPTGTPSPARP